MQFCAPRMYTTPVFMAKAQHHRIVAVLPFEMVFSGKQPKKMTAEQIEKLEEVESIAFQNSLYHALLRQKELFYNRLRIGIQRVEKTNRILDQEGIGIRESWEIDPVELARILGVDAVIRTQVIKRRYMSDGASFGITVGSTILSALLDDSLDGLFVSAPTKTIRSECVLHNGSDGVVLWAIKTADDTDWRLPANEIVDSVTHFFARKFPYR